MIANAPGVLNSRVDWGRLQDLTIGRQRSVPDAVAESDRVRLQAAARRPVEHRCSAQAGRGGHPRRRLRRLQVHRPAAAGADQRRAVWRDVPAPEPGSDARPERDSWNSALPNDFLRPYPGYGNIRMWDYSGYADYKALQTSVTRRFDRGFMLSGFWVWSKAQGINSTDFCRRRAESERGRDQAPRLLAAGLRPDAQLHGQRHLPDTDRDGKQRRSASWSNDWQLSGVYRWTSGRPYTVNFSIPGIGAANLTGTDGNPERARSP